MAVAWDENVLFGDRVQLVMDKAVPVCDNLSAIALNSAHLRKHLELAA